MTATLQELKRAASDLPSDDREELIDFLLQLPPENGDDGVRSEWTALAERRMTEVKAGRVVGIPADEVLRTLLGSNP